MSMRSCPCSLFPTPVGGVRQWRVWDGKHGKSVEFSKAGVYFEQIWSYRQVMRSRWVKMTERLGFTWQDLLVSLLPGNPPHVKVTLECLEEGRREGGITVTLTLFLNWPLTPVQTHLVQAAFGLEGARGQVHRGFSFPTDSSGNLEIQKVPEAFNDLKQTNDAWRW